MSELASALPGLYTWVVLCSLSVSLTDAMIAGAGRDVPISPGAVKAAETVRVCGAGTAAGAFLACPQTCAAVLRGGGRRALPRPCEEEGRGGGPRPGNEALPVLGEGAGMPMLGIPSENSMLALRRTCAMPCSWLAPLATEVLACWRRFEGFSRGTGKAAAASCVSGAGAAAGAFLGCPQTCEAVLRGGGRRALAQTLEAEGSGGGARRGSGAFPLSGEGARMPMLGLPSEASMLPRPFTCAMLWSWLAPLAAEVVACWRRFECMSRGTGKASADSGAGAAGGAFLGCPQTCAAVLRGGGRRALAQILEVEGSGGGARICGAAFLPSCGEAVVLLLCLSPLLLLAEGRAGAPEHVRRLSSALPLSWSVPCLWGLFGLLGELGLRAFAGEEFRLPPGGGLLNLWPSG